MSVARRERRANRARPRPPHAAAGTPAATERRPSGSGGRLAVSAGGGRTAGLALALVALTLVVYAPVRHHGFLNWDDPEYVTENVEVLRGLTWRGVAWAFTTGYAAN